MAPARPCPACGHTGARDAFTADGFLHVRCTRCATLFVAHVPTAAEIESLYLAPHYHSTAAGQEQRMRGEADERARTLQAYGCRTVLEVGCGPGHFLDAVRELGMAVEGVDRAPTAAGPRSRGHLVHDVWLQDLAPAPRFDAVALWEVLEHLADPKDMLLQVRKFLRPGGLLALSTPSSSGLPARLMGRRFVMVCPPDHLELFSRRGLATLLAATGFEPRRWTSFSGLGREPLRRGFQRFLLGNSGPARLVAGALALAAELPMKLVDRAGFGSGFEVYATLQSA